MARERVGVLAGGGGVPGLDSVIMSVMWRSNEIDWEEDRPGAARRGS